MYTLLHILYTLHCTVSVYSIIEWRACSVDYLADNVINTSHRGPDYGGLGLGTASWVCNVDQMIFQTEHVAQQRYHYLNPRSLNFFMAFP